MYLLDELGLRHVMVIGNPFGGWVSSEMTLRDIDHRLEAMVPLNAIGIRPDQAGQVTDIRQLPPAAVSKPPSTTRRCAPIRPR